MYSKNIFQEEEDEGGGAGGGYYKDIPQNQSLSELALKLEFWWEELTKNLDYKLYAVIFALQTDSEIISFIDEYRNDLKRISGCECCFMYFRDEHKAISGVPWDFSEHSRMAISLSIMLKLDEFPSIVFFERISSKDYVCFPIKNTTKEDILNMMRELFLQFYSDEHKNISPMERIRNYSNIFTIKRITNSALDKSDFLLSDFVKSVVNKMVSVFLG